MCKWALGIELSVWQYSLFEGQTAASSRCWVWQRTQGACLINPLWRPPSSDKHVCGTVLFCSLFCCTCMPTVSLHETPFMYTSFYYLCFTASLCSFVMFFSAFGFSRYVVLMSFCLSLNINTGSASTGTKRQTNLLIMIGHALKYYWHAKQQILAKMKANYGKREMSKSVFIGLTEVNLKSNGSRCILLQTQSLLLSVDPLASKVQ